MLNQKAIFIEKNRQIELYRIRDTRWPEPIKSRVCVPVFAWFVRAHGGSDARARVLTLCCLPCLSYQHSWAMLFIA